MKEGSVDILGGLIQRTDTRTLNGWPGLAKIPVIRYLFSSDSTEHQEDEVLIMLIPHIVRLPEWTKENLKAIYTGSDQEVQVRRATEVRTPAPEKTVPPGQSPTAPAPGATSAYNGRRKRSRSKSAARSARQAEIRAARSDAEGGRDEDDRVVVDNVNDLFSIPMLLQYNPAVMSIVDIQHAVGEGQHGGFLSGGTQEIAIVSNVNKEKGQAIISATRQPNTRG